MNYKMVVVIRNDLKLSVGKVSAQVAHGAVSCALDAKKHKRKWFKKWYKEGQKKIVLKAENLEQLFKLKTEAERMGVTTSLIIDAGFTEIPPNTITCLGIGPASNEIIDSITGKLPLL